jgi:CheY-like chemotaxis protein
MARVLALLPDLLFGSKVQGMLASAGHDVAVIASEPDAREQIAGNDVLIVDLCSDDIDGIGLVDALSTDGALEDTKVLAFFRHTEPEVRERALAAGFDVVVPRSRMNREGVALVDGLLAG